MRHHRHGIAGAVLADGGVRVTDVDINDAA